MCGLLQGACENCGSMTHKKNDCVERPRSLKKSAKVRSCNVSEYLDQTWRMDHSLP